MIIECIIKISLILIIIINNGANWIIHSYLTNKALGFQTLLDRFGCDLAKTNTLAMYTFCTCVYFFMVDIPKWMATIIFFTSNFSNNLFLTWLLMTMTCKYLIIFHPTAVEVEETDSEMMTKVRKSAVFITLFGMCIEFGFLSQPKQFSNYQVLSGEINKSEQGFPKLTMLLFVMIISLIVYTQIKIQKQGLLKTVNAENIDDDSRNMKKQIKMAFFVIILSSFIALLILFKTDLSDKSAAVFNAIVVIFLYCIIPPLGYIWKSNGNLVNHGKSILEKWTNMASIAPSE